MNFRTFVPQPIPQSNQRFIHSSLPLLQRPDHALYQRIDWEIVRSGKYAVVDPLDPHSVKYLSNREYIIDSRVAMSNDITLIVLATPVDQPLPFIKSDPSDPKNSPPKGEVDEEGFARFQTRRGRAAMLRFMFTTPFLADLISQSKDSKRAARARRAKKQSDFRHAHKLNNDTSPTDRSEFKIPNKNVAQSSRPNVKGSDPASGKPLDVLDYLDATRIRVKDREEERFDPMVVLNNRNIVKIIRKWALIVHFRVFGLAETRGFEKAITAFASHLSQVFRHQGVQQVILRLKVYLHATFAYLAGRPLKSTRDLKTPVRLCHGLPRAFPASTRHAIRSRSIQAIRTWTSICGMYKGIKGTWGRPDYTDIIQPDIQSLGNQKLLHFSQFCTGIFSRLLPGYAAEGGQIFHGMPVPLSAIKTKDMYVSTKGGPNGKSLISVHWDLVAWLVLAGHELGYFKDKTILISVDDLSSKQHPFREFIGWCTLNLDVIFTKLPWGRMMLLTRDIRFKHAITKLVFALEELDLVAIADIPGNPITSGFARDDEARDETGTRSRCPKGFEGHLEPLWCRTGKQGGLNVAKLVALYEPAGKVRNIVMVTWLVQQLLLPVHNILFQFLKALPTDATFDQEGTVEAFSKRDYKFLASFDLKAATETISQSLYVALFEPIFETKATRGILDLLVDCDVAVSSDAEAKWGSHVRYTRGQPMGALGSWASMALVHHALVQFCAYSSGEFNPKTMWFGDYLVLGDDIVIANEKVAKAYKEVCDELGVKIGLPKSFISNTSFFNFANQSFFNKNNISPISFREEISARSPGTRMELALRMVRRGILDVSSSGWLSPLLRSVLPASIYQVVAAARVKGRVDPAVSAVLAATFGVLSRMTHDEFTKCKLEVFQGLSVWGYVRLLKAKVNLFSEQVQTVLGRGPDLSQDPGVSEVVLGLLQREADLLYRSFLRIKPILTDWKAKAKRSPQDGRITNPQDFFGTEFRYLVPILVSYATFGQKMDELLEWETKYRRVLKTILVCYSLQPITIELFEHTCGSLEELWSIVVSARRELPVNPDVILGAVPKPAPAMSQDNIFEQSGERFSRFVTLIELSNAASQEPAFSRRFSLTGPMEKGLVLPPFVFTDSAESGSEPESNH